MSQKIIISLVGAKQSGKTTSAFILNDMLHNSHVTAIADKLKVECSVAYDIDLIHFHSQDLKEESMIYPIRTKIENLSHLIESFKLSDKPVNISSDTLLELSTTNLRTPRDIMQHAGMFLRNVFGKHIHLKHLDLSNEITIVSDVRFKNEFDYLDKLPGYVHIPLYIHNKKAESSGDNHVSEQEFKKFTKKCIFVDNNEKDIEALYRKLELAMGLDFED